VAAVILQLSEMLIVLKPVLYFTSRGNSLKLVKNSRPEIVSSGCRNRGVRDKQESEDWEQFFGEDD
jgi:hypothetical protein